MSTNLVIVAIPADDDPVWKISSEKIPHLTLLFLGEAENNPNVEQIMQFVHHAVAVSEHGGFMLNVDRRGTLGDDEADVLFFEKDWSFQWIKRFRSQLLQNGSVRAAYDSAEQYPEWLPHLTLGYPETPAKPIEDDRSIHWVNFDRIAVWTGNYEGPSFRLKWPERGLEEMPMLHDLGSVPISELQHFGVKGMRWGVRKDTQVTVGGKTKLVSAKKAEKLDKNWEKNIYSIPGAVAVHNKMADHFNSRIGALNDKYSDVTLSDKDYYADRSMLAPRKKEYLDAVDNLTMEGNRLAVQAVHGSSPTGKKRAELDVAGERVIVRPVEDKVKHAAEDAEIAVLRIIRDDSGRIVSVEPLFTEDSMEQTVTRGAEFLEHFGVKGMKWGIRNDRQGRSRWSPKTDESVGDDLARMVIFPPITNIPATVRVGKRAGQKVSAKWKARNTPEAKAARSDRRARRANAIGDFFWESGVHSSAQKAAVHNRVSDELDQKMYLLQTAPKYRGKNLKADKALKREYKQDVEKVSDAAYRRAVKDVYGDNVSGTKTAVYVNDVRGARIEIRDKRTGETSSESSLNRLEEDLEQSAISHAETAPDISISIREDSNGMIASIGRILTEDDLPFLDDENVEHSATEMEYMADLGAEFLEHFGVKGMRWGVRKERPAPTPVAPKAKIVVPHGDKRKTKVKVEGGQNHPASEDAIRVAEAKAKLKKSGTVALSNQELRDVAQRMQLEQQVTQMTASGGRRFISNLLRTQGQNEVNARIQRDRNRRLNTPKAKDD